MKTKSKGEAEADIRKFCDLVMHHAVRVMADSGASTETIIDRLLTVGAAHSVAIQGAANTATAFRIIPKNIEGGALARVEAQFAEIKH